MKGLWDAVIQQAGGASPVIQQFTVNTALPASVAQNQLIEQTTPTIVVQNPQGRIAGVSSVTICLDMLMICNG